MCEYNSDPEAYRTKSIKGFTNPRLKIRTKQAKPAKRRGKLGGVNGSDGGEYTVFCFIGSMIPCSGERAVLGDPLALSSVPFNESADRFGFRVFPIRRELSHAVEL